MPLVGVPLDSKIDRDATLVGSELERVAEQVHERNFDALWVQWDRGDVVGTLHFELDLTLVTNRAEGARHLTYEHLEIGRAGPDPEGAGIDLGKIQDLVDETKKPHRIAVNDGQILGHCRIDRGQKALQGANDQR